MEIIKEVNANLLRGKDIKPRKEIHFNNNVLVISLDLYEKKSFPYTLKLYENGKFNIKDGIYYRMEPWDSALLCDAQFKQFYKKYDKPYGKGPTISEKKKCLKQDIILIKIKADKGNLYEMYDNEWIEVGA